MDRGGVNRACALDRRYLMTDPTEGIRWAGNPRDTSRADLVWFLLIPATMALMFVGVVVTSLAAP